MFWTVKTAGPAASSVGRPPKAYSEVVTLTSVNPQLSLTKPIISP